MKKLFDDEKVNIGRQYEMDLLRGFTAIVLIVCHVGLYLGKGASPWLYSFCDIIGSEPGAPIFMALMGTSIIYSRHGEPAQLFARGVKLFLGGYILNLFRSLIPFLLLGPVNFFASLRCFFIVDILQFAGLSFMFFALLRKYKVPSAWILLLSLVLVGMDQMLMLPKGGIWDNGVVSAVADLFVPVTAFSCFPFLTWFFFPALGMWFGEWLVCCRDKDKLYMLLLPFGFAGVGYVLFQFYHLYPNIANYYYGNDFYYMGIKNVLLAACYFFFMIAFWHFVGKVLPRFVGCFLKFLSYNLTRFFIMSWLVIGALIHAQSVLGWRFNDCQTIGLMAGIMILTSALTKLYARYRQRAES